MKNFLAAKIVLVFTAALLFTMTPARAGVPVIDSGNLSQNMISAFEEVTQTLKQVEQYATQLQQYETQLQQYQNMIQNTVAPVAYLWDDVQGIMNKLMATANLLDYYKQKAGSIDGYLSKFQDIDYYKSSPCFTASGCSDAEWAALQQSQTLGSGSQKKANDALFKILNDQQDSIAKDTANLKQLQSQATGAKGQMEALGAANQLAGAQITQLLEIRGLLVAQNQAWLAKNQNDANNAALEAATAKKMTENRFKEQNDSGFGIQ